MTPLYAYRAETADLRRVHRVKQESDQGPAEPALLGPEMLALFDKSIAKRQTKAAKLVDVWLSLVPETLADHCAFAGFVKGSLTVLVDSASHLYELKQLLLAGLQQQLLIAGRSQGLRKIVLKMGRATELPLPVNRERGGVRVISHKNEVRRQK